MKLAITTSYTISGTTVFDMPDGKTWDDVEIWGVKWDTLFLTFKDGTEKEIRIDEASTDSVDWKRPDRAEIYPVDEDGGADWSVNELDSITN